MNSWNPSINCTTKQKVKKELEEYERLLLDAQLARYHFLLITAKEHSCGGGIENSNDVINITWFHEVG